MITWSVIINGFGICYMLHVCVCSPVISRARRKSASDFSFVLYFSNASDSLKVQDAYPEYLPSRSSTVDIIHKLLSRKLSIVL